MDKYEYYIFSRTATYYDSISDALEAFEGATELGYKALGITKNGIYSCDLLCQDKTNMWISDDRYSMPHFIGDTYVESMVAKIEFYVKKIESKNRFVKDYAMILLSAELPDKIVDIVSLDEDDAADHFNEIRASLLEENKLYLLGLLEGVVVDDYGLRQCSNCGKFFRDGFCIDGGESYHCSETCLHTVFTAEEWDELYEDSGDSYYSEWSREW